MKRSVYVQEDSSDYIEDEKVRQRNEWKAL